MRMKYPFLLSACLCRFNLQGLERGDGHRLPTVVKESQGEVTRYRTVAL